MNINEKKSFDVIVIGGGAAGMMAAITAASNGADTMILEHKDRVGKKILSTGNGKCNYTNELSRFIAEMTLHLCCRSWNSLVLTRRFLFLKNLVFIQKAGMVTIIRRASRRHLY